jgi:hypothetical protein
MTAPATTIPLATVAKGHRFAAVHPVLFAAYAVLFLWSQNLGETNPRQVLLPFLAVMLGATLVTVVLGVVFRDRRRGALVATPLVVGLLMYGHAHHLLASVSVPTFVQQAGWAALVVVAVIAAIRLDDGRISTIDWALDRVAGILVLVTLVLIVPFQVNAFMSRASIPQVQPVGTTTAAEKRDVYWFIFDRYGSERALQLQYGIDNDLPEWLEAHDFKVLEDSHANYIRTVLSMATTVQMQHLDAVAKAQGARSEDITTVNEWLQDPPVARQFKALGYHYDHIGSAFDPTRTDRGADVNHTVPSPPGTGDFEDALFDTSAVPALLKRLHLPPASDRVRQYTFSTYALDAVAGLRDEPGPKFVMTHVLLPHPPLVFDVDGTFIEDAEVTELGAAEMYRRQLAYTNARIEAIVTDLQSLPENRRPIVILQADEGPWPRSYATGRKTDGDWPAGASEKELEQKYGILNAWYMPGGEDLGLYPSMTAINTFPTLFSRYFGLDYVLLPDRIYSSSDWYHPYDLTDITDRLPSLR